MPPQASVMRGLGRGGAVALLAACVAMTAFLLASLSLPGTERIPDRPSVGEILTFAMIFLTFPSVGLIVVWKRPENPVGWLFLAIGATITLSVFSSEYAGWAIYARANVPGAAFVAWLGSWSWTSASSIALPLALMLFPNGRLPSPRWRPAVIIGVIGATVAIVALAIRPGDLTDYERILPNPFGVSGVVGELATAVAAHETVPMLYMTLLALAALVRRFHGAGTERQQLKWLLYPAALFVVALVTAGTTENEAAWTAVLVLLAAIPVSAGVAILRYRIYDIDLVIRRTLIYGVVVGVLGAAYVALVVGLQDLLTGITGNDALPVALSTLLIAGLFGPVRSRVREAIDRRFYRSRYRTDLTLAAFAGRLRDEVELDEVARTLIATAGHAVRPASVVVWMRRGDGR